MPTTIAEIQAKLIKAFENRIKGQLNEHSLKTKLPKGDFTFEQFSQALTFAGSPLTDQEAEFLYVFWDTQAGAQEQTGFVSADLAAKDLASSMDEFNNGGLPSGDVTGPDFSSGNQSNRSSQPDGIFGGGAYAADADVRSGIPAYVGAPPSYKPATDNGSSRPRGNQSSVPGGILAHDENAPAQPPSSRGGGNKSNQSSLQGGIFGKADVPEKRRNPTKSNQSSIEGGIFG